MNDSGKSPAFRVAIEETTHLDHGSRYRGLLIDGATGTVRTTTAEYWTRLTAERGAWILGAALYGVDVAAELSGLDCIAFEYDDHGCKTPVARRGRC